MTLDSLIFLLGVSTSNLSNLNRIKNPSQFYKKAKISSKLYPYYFFVIIIGCVHAVSYNKSSIGFPCNFDEMILDLIKRISSVN